MSKTKKSKDQPVVDKSLDGMNIIINEFGEIKSNISIDKLNEFLDKKTVDKKFKDVEVKRSPKQKKA